MRYNNTLLASYFTSERQRQEGAWRMNIQTNLAEPQVGLALPFHVFVFKIYQQASLALLLILLLLLRCCSGHIEGHPGRQKQTCTQVSISQQNSSNDPNPPTRFAKNVL